MFESLLFVGSIAGFALVLLWCLKNEGLRPEETRGLLAMRRAAKKGEGAASGAVRRGNVNFPE
jgi:hypothetical protein